MKILTLRIDEEHLIKELKALKKSFDIKTDSKLIKHLIATARANSKEFDEITWENNDLKKSLQKEQQERKNFSNALKQYTK